MTQTRLAVERRNRAVAAVGVAAIALLALLACVAWAGPTAIAQDSGEGSPSTAATPSDDTGSTGASPGTNADSDSGDDAASSGIKKPPQKSEGIRILSLLRQGGWFMAPIWLMAILALAFAIERLIALRRQRVLPHDLVEALGKLGGSTGGFDPRQAYRICQQYPSAASNVIRAMLLKVGRPHSEVEHTVQESSQREADRMYGNVRWLNLAAAVSPLLGLLGTVWGMIVAFIDTTRLTAGENRADALAEGIYTALVTTLLGLSVAIPAVIIAHFLEGRIQTLFHQIDELLSNLLPQVERYEGRVRFGRPAGEGEGVPAVSGTAAASNEPGPPPVQARAAAK